MPDIGDTLVWNGANWQNAGGSSLVNNDNVAPNVFVNDPNNVGVIESWHTLHLLNGWTNSSSNPPSIQLVSSPPNSVMVVLYLTPGTVADGTAVANVPTTPNDANGNGIGTYTPLTNKWLAAVTDAEKVSPVSGSTNESAALLVQASSGQLQCYGVGTAATRFSLVGIYPCDL